MISAVFALMAFIVLKADASPADSVTHCSMGSYQYSGAVFSDSYGMNKIAGAESCRLRKEMDSESINKNYKENRSRIEAVIDGMLVNPECEDSIKVLNEYRDKLGRHWSKFDAHTKERIELLKSLSQEIDMQRFFALIGAFNATCAGGQNRKTSFIDLDLMNKIPVSYYPITINKDNQTAENCGDVIASGNEDLKSFKVSMKKAKGDEMNFLFDPYGIPDQVIVKSSGGEVLYDSGCKGNDSFDQQEPIKLPVKKGDLNIEVVNNCASSERKPGESAWEIRVQCQQEPDQLCKEPKAELTRLLKQEVQFNKLLMDANSMQFECLLHLDSSLLEDLLANGLISQESAPLKNGICDTMDEECEVRQINARKSEKADPAPSLSREVSSAEEFKCPEEAFESDKEPLFNKISRTYCRIGRERLGLEEYP